MHYVIHSKEARRGKKCLLYISNKTANNKSRPCLVQRRAVIEVIKIAYFHNKAVTDAPFIMFAIRANASRGKLTSSECKCLAKEFLRCGSQRTSRQLEFSYRLIVIKVIKNHDSLSATVNHRFPRAAEFLSALFPLFYFSRYRCILISCTTSIDVKIFRETTGNYASKR